MNRVLLTIAVVLACLFLAVTSFRLFKSQSHAQLERDRTDQLRIDVAQHADLLERRASVQLGEPPQEDLLRRLHETMHASGLPSAAFSGLSTTTDEAIRTSPGHRRKGYRLELTGLETADLGSFLDRWKQREPMWLVEGIELRRDNSRNRTNRPPVGKYSAVIRVSTIYAAPEAVKGSGRP